MDTLADKKISWLINLRWFAISMILILIWPAIHFGYLPQNFLILYLIIAAMLLIFNLVQFFSFFSFLKKISLQLNIDLLAFSFLIFLTGKIENPFWSLIYFHAAFGAVVLPRGKDLYFLPFLYASLAFIQFSSIEYYSSIAFTLLPQWIIVTAIWFLSRNLSLYTQKQQLLIQRFNEKELKHQKLKSIAALSSGILHEIGTPLNTIRLKVERMKNKGMENFTPKDLKFLDLSLQSIEDVTSKLNQSQYELTQDHLSTLEINNYLTHELKQIETNYPKIQISFNPIISYQVKLSKQHFQLVLKNLLENAQDAQATKMEISLQDLSPRFIKINFSDNGSGFNEEIIEHFGSPYISTKGKGHGIGLYSSLLCLESMGGNLNIQNINHHASVDIFLERDHES